MAESLNGVVKRGALTETVVTHAAQMGLRRVRVSIFHSSGPAAGSFTACLIAPGIPELINLVRVFRLGTPGNVLWLGLAVAIVPFVC